MIRRLSVRAIIFQDGKLLAARLTPDAGRPEKGTFWCLPGGGLESTESLPAGLDREMLEETGIKPDLGNLLYIQQFKDKQCEYLEFFFVVTNTSAYTAINLSETTHGVAEIADIRFIDPVTSNLLPIFLRERNIADDIQSGKTYYFNYL